MAGRPQTYIGALEDAVVEARSAAWELVTADVREMALHDAIQALQGQADAYLAEGDVASARRSLADARGLMVQLRKHDLAENSRHRALARGGSA